MANPQTENGLDHNHAMKEPTEWMYAMTTHSYRQNRPGNCRICGMELVPVPSQAGEKTAGMRQLTISPAARELMNIQTRRVERRYVEAEVV